MPKDYEKATLKRPTLVQGAWKETGDEVEVAPFQKRHFVEHGYAEGKVPEDIVSPGEEEQGALNAFKKAAERDDVDAFTAQGSHEAGWGFGEAQSGDSTGPSPAEAETTSGTGSSGAGETRSRK